MDAHQKTNIDEIARRSPTALCMALERALTTCDRELERTTLAALDCIGLALVDRAKLLAALSHDRDDGPQPSSPPGRTVR